MSVHALAYSLFNKLKREFELELNEMDFWDGINN